MVNKNQSKRSAGRKKLLLGILERHRTLQCKIWRELERNLERRGFTDEIPRIGQLLTADLELKRAIYVSHRLGDEFLKTLSPKQREVMRWCLRGLRRKAIAEHTGIRLRTVDTHLERARHKCGAHSNEEFTREVPLLN